LDCFCETRDCKLSVKFSLFVKLIVYHNYQSGSCGISANLTTGGLSSLTRYSGEKLSFSLGLLQIQKNNHLQL